MANGIVLPSGNVLPLQDPRKERANRVRFGRDRLPELEYANCLLCPSGRWPACGWLLLARSDYDQISKLAPFQLQIDDFLGNGPLTFPNLYVVSADCVSRGVAADPNAVYLVKVTDARGIIYNPWYQQPTTSQYNIRSPAYPEQFYQLSLNAGSPWTWAQAVGDLWAQMPLLGPYPGLPEIFPDNPENWYFPGMAAWDALHQILELQGLTVAVDLTSTTPYSIVEAGSADAAFTALQAQYVPNLEDDLEPQSVGAGRAPGQVTVFFRRRNQYYGTEETVRRDSLQWSSTPLYSIPVPSPAPFTGAPGSGFVWSGFSVRFDVDGNPLAADVANALVVAVEDVNEYFDIIYRGTSGSMRQTYVGTIPFKTGGQVDGVRWHQDFQEGRKAWRTEIIRGFVWPEVMFETTARGLRRP